MALGMTGTKALLGKIGAVSSTALLMGSTKTGFQMMKEASGLGAQSFIASNGKGLNNTLLNTAVGAGIGGGTRIAMNLASGERWNNKLGRSVLGGGVGGFGYGAGMNAGKIFSSGLRQMNGVGAARTAGARAIMNRARSIPLGSARTGVGRGVLGMSRASSRYYGF